MARTWDALTAQTLITGRIETTPEGIRRYQAPQSDMRNFSLVTVNMSLTRRCMHSSRPFANGDLLKLFVQEPWLRRLGANRNDEVYPRGRSL